MVFLPLDCLLSYRRVSVFLPVVTPFRYPPLPQKIALPPIWFLKFLRYFIVLLLLLEPYLLYSSSSSTLVQPKFPSHILSPSSHSRVAWPVPLISFLHFPTSSSIPSVWQDPPRVVSQTFLHLHPPPLSLIHTTRARTSSFVMRCTLSPTPDPQPYLCRRTGLLHDTYHEPQTIHASCTMPQTTYRRGTDIWKPNFPDWGPRPTPVHVHTSGTMADRISSLQYVLSLRNWSCTRFAKSPEASRDSLTLIVRRHPPPPPKKRDEKTIFLSSLHHCIRVLPD